MRRFYFFALVASLALFGRRAEAQCRGADSLGTQLVRQWRQLVVSVGEPRVQIGTWGISTVDSSTVALVSDKATCSKALKAYNATLAPGMATPSGAVYVLKVGPRYVVRDPVQKGGDGWYHTIILDTKFLVIAEFMG